MSNWGTLNHHHLPFYSIETFIRAAKNANKTLVICFSNFLHFERTKNHRMVKKDILNIKATQITNCTSEIYLIQQKPLLTQFSSLKSRVWAWFII